MQHKRLSPVKWPKMNIYRASKIIVLWVYFHFHRFFPSLHLLILSRTERICSCLAVLPRPEFSLSQSTSSTIQSCTVSSHSVLTIVFVVTHLKSHCDLVQMFSEYSTLLSLFSSLPRPLFLSLSLKIMQMRSQGKGKQNKY